MLTDDELAAFRSRLVIAAQELANEDDLGKPAQARVRLDQQSVGRLSRMDAMQQQAMAQATGRRRQAGQARIAAALQRMAEGEYGYCVECGEEIARARLDLDPAIPTCLSCARG